MAQLSAQGPVIAPHATSVTDSAAKLPVGTRMRDVSGNEYVYVDIGATFGVGQWVSLAPSYTIDRISNTTRGPIGILVVASSSDNYGWVQIYGTYDAAQIGTSSFTSVYWLAAPAGATTASAVIASSTDNVDKAVFGAWLTGASNTTTATSQTHTGYYASVMLNYPFLMGTTVKATT